MPRIFISPQNNIVYIFLALTILLGVSVIIGVSTISYGAEIIITPAPKEIDVNFRIEITQNQENISNENETLNGYIVETIQTAEQSYTAQSIVSMEDYAEGEIRLTNNTFSPINFVASTRFASPDGLIFRAINRIHIPSKGTATAPVRADQMGPAYDIEPSTFTIPGLTSPTLIENITAVSEKNMTGGLKKTGIVLEADIDNAEKDLYDNLYALGIDEIETHLYETSPIQTGLKIILEPVELEKQTNAKAGEEKAEFTSFLTLKIGAVAFLQNKLLDSAVLHLKNKIPEHNVLAAYEPESLSYRLVNYNKDEGRATLEVQLRGFMIVTKDHNIFSKARLRDLSASEAKTILSDVEEIKNVEVKLWPPFILKKIPGDIDKIDIILKKIK